MMVISYLGTDNTSSHLYDSFLINPILFGQSGQEPESVLGSEASVMVAETSAFGL